MALSRAEHWKEELVNELTPLNVFLEQVEGQDYPQLFQTETFL